MDHEAHHELASERLARLLAVGTDEADLWRPEDLGAVFRHQWSATVDYEIDGLGQVAGRRLAILASAQGLLVRSYRDLFGHPCPPVGLLILTKDYAKALLASEDCPIPRGIASALYYTSILVARYRLGRRITTLGDTDLVRGVGWLLERTWVDGETKALLRAGLEHCGLRQAGNNPPAMPAEGPEI
jgi:hypothetical protein